ncbi:hypothetical protein [Mesorhizobium sp.]|uniref:hypothetical protein n=1 Tax=Mesorhizobium sp. TaxID=1871066 RepID=UPI000FE5601F|nr:hypothetical protein [Mesorhizobium sp.]RWB66562.1 MAG: hypothetical protein EOQ49_28130 [Mesorhizobium sp.]
MASYRFRTCFFTSVGLLIAALVYVLPISTDGPFDHALSYRVIHVEQASFMLPDLGPVAAKVAMIRSENETALPASHTPQRALGPVYALSLQTDGHSLVDYHRRC